MLRNRTAGALCAVAITVLAAACTNASSETANDAPTSKPSVDVNAAAAELLPAPVKSAGKLVFASDASYAPFEYFGNDNTTMIGFDIQLGDALAEVLGVKAQHVNAGFDTILPGLQAKKYDAGMSAFGVTAERRQVVDFVPYLSMGTGLAVKKGNPDGLTLDDTTTLCGRRVSAQKGSIQGISVLPKLSTECTKAGKAAISIHMFPSQNEANLALSSGRVDAIMADSVPMAYQGKEAGGSFELAPGKDYEPTTIAIALPKGSDLGPAFSAAMKVLLDNGTLAKLLEQWDVPPSGIIGSTDLIR